MPEFGDYIDDLPVLPTRPAGNDKVPVLRDGALYASFLQLAELAQRVAVLEGGGTTPTPVPPPAPEPAPEPPPAPPPAEKSFDFTASSTPPSDVTVVRAGTTGMYRNASGVWASASANAIRIEHNAAGDPIGAWMEPADENLLIRGHKPSAANGWTVQSAATVTPGWGTGPDGTANVTTRVQVSAGNAFVGMFRGVTSLTAGQVRIALLAKAVGSAQTLGLRNPATNAATESGSIPTSGFTELVLTGQWGGGGGSNHFNFNVNSNLQNTALDMEVWGLSLIKDAPSRASVLLNDTDSTVTRPKEVFTFTLDSADTYDVAVTFEDDTVQWFSDQVVGGGLTWELDADELDQRLVKSVVFYPQGSASAPPPSAPPPSAPPPASGAVWTSDMVTRLMRTANGLNEGPIANVDTNAGGWRSGSGIALGKIWYPTPQPTDWNWPTGNGAGQWWRYFYPWGVIYTEDGNTATDGWVELRNMEWQVLYRNDTMWTAHQPVTQSVGWGNIFADDMITDTGVAITRRPGASGIGESIKLPLTGSPHFTFGLPVISVPNVENIESVIVTCEYRIDPRGDQHVKALVMVSGDPKYTNQGNAADGVPWYPGVGPSAAMRATTSWQRVTSCPTDEGRIDRGLESRVCDADLVRAYPPRLRT